MIAKFLKRIGSPARWQDTEARDWHQKMTSNLSAPSLALLQGQINGNPGTWEFFDVDTFDDYHDILEIRHGAARRAQEVIITQYKLDYESGLAKVRTEMTGRTGTLTAAEAQALRDSQVID